MLVVTAHEHSFLFNRKCVAATNAHNCQARSQTTLFNNET